MGAYVYIIMSSVSGVLYVGVTGNLKKRAQQHKSGRVPGFTQRCRIKKLVYSEKYPEVRDALAREKQRVNAEGAGALSRALKRQSRKSPGRRPPGHGGGRRGGVLPATRPR